MTSNPFHNRYLILSFVGLLFSSVLLYHHVEVTSGVQIGPSFCAINETFDCDAVAKSAYSIILGLPTASWALIFYFGVLLYLAGRDGAPGEPNESDVMLVLAAAAAVPTAYMFSVSLLIIKKICIYCTVLYFTNLALLGAAIIDPSRSRPFSAALSGGFAGIGRLLARPFDSALLVFCFAAFVAAVAVAPNKIILPYLTRYQVRDTDSVTRKLIFDTWNATPVSQIPLDLGTDPATKDWSKGPQTAAVTLVEFFDYQCPHCKNFGLAAEQLLKRYPKDLMIVVKNFPLDPTCNKYTPRGSHKLSCKIAETARCVGMKSPELYWEFNRRVFSAPEMDPARLDKTLADLGIAKAEMDSCLADPATLAKIRSDTDDGFNLKINHTPTIYINGKLSESSEISRIEAIIDQLLERLSGSDKTQTAKPAN